MLLSVERLSGWEEKKLSHARNTSYGASDVGGLSVDRCMG